MRTLRAIALLTPLVLPLSDCEDGCSRDAPAPASPTDSDPAPQDDPPTTPDAPCVPSYGGLEVADGVDNDCNGAIDDFAAPIHHAQLPRTANDLANIFQEEDAEPAYISLTGLDFAGAPAAGGFTFGLAFAPDDALAILDANHQVFFLTHDGALRGGRAKPLDEGSTDEHPGEFYDERIDAFVEAVPGFATARLAQGADRVVGFAVGSWTEELATRADDRHRNGTTFFEVDPTTGSRREVIGRIEDVFLERALFTPEGQIVGWGFDALNNARDDVAGGPLLFLDALGDRIALDATDIDEASLTAEPRIGGDLYACSTGADKRILKIAADGDIEPALGLNADCGFTVTFGQNGILYSFAVNGGALEIIGIDTQRTAKAFTLYRDPAIVPGGRLIAMDESSDHIWLTVREQDLSGDLEYNLYRLPLGGE